ncbi:shikimate dehydrogenase [Flavihumibacter sp. ZG627]|uniref:shikimate dehydrogenase family protein n=1 Tax=Flavihumibacter sp. ZG627 TaxID=1463156 RepID=UPI00057D1A61|nr:shikimate dehydrogenase [Flavihumibacter sp. ZG627]KIC89794.1 shikimate dehydrogenase [Flavihumibacter sp. ZG627]
MRQFGLIGYPLGHSFSKGYFTEKFKREGIDATYNNFPMASVQEVPALMLANPLLEGFNITIPHKETIIPYLHSANDVVKTIGACNCVKIQDGKMQGFNTDVIGFELSLKKYLRKEHAKALVFGTGGASKAVQYILSKLGIEFIIVSRKMESNDGTINYGSLTEDLLRSSTLWINTTPVGMYPNEDSILPLNYEAIGARHYLYDLVYNPAETRFLKEARQRGATIANGYDMLIIQAEESWRIWNSNE